MTLSRTFGPNGSCITPDERQLFEQMVRPTVESGNNVTTERSVYLQAQTPSL